MQPKTTEDNGAWPSTLRSYLQRSLHALANAIDTESTQRTTKGDEETPFGLNDDQVMMIHTRMSKHERYRVRRLMLERHQLDRDLCHTERAIRSYMTDMSRKYLPSEAPN